MRYEKHSLLLSVFCCWQAVLSNDTGQPLSWLVLQPQHLLRGILPIPGSILSRNRTWVTHCPRGRPRLGIYRHCRLPPCISVPLSNRPGCPSAERERPSLHCGLTPTRLGEFH